MRTPKSLYAQKRLIYHPELMSCPCCGALLVGCNYLKWDKPDSIELRGGAQPRWSIAA